jgi:phasin
MIDAEDSALITEPATPAPAPIETLGAVETAAAPVAAFHETARRTVEKGLAESRAAYSRAKLAADEAVGALETSVTTASKGAIDLNIKALDALRANIDAGFDLAKATLTVKTLGELVSLQSKHASKQAEIAVAQAREFGALAQKIAVDAAEPIKAQVAKAFKLSA